MASAQVRLEALAKNVVPVEHSRVGISASIVGDVDGDGYRDLLLSVSSELRVLRNQTDGTFADVTATSLGVTLEDLRFSHLVDLDADGDLDLLATKFLVGPILYLNDGAGAFTDATANLNSTLKGSAQPLVFDADGDGDDDVLLLELRASGLGESYLLTNQGNATFVETSGVVATQLTANFNRAAAGDVDGDGDIDFVMIQTVFAGRVFPNDGSGMFTELVGALPVVDQRMVILVDLDGDGDPDCVSSGINEVRLLINDGNGMFADESQRLPAGLGTSVLHQREGAIHRHFRFAVRRWLAGCGDRHRRRRRTAGQPGWRPVRASQ